MPRSAAVSKAEDTDPPGAVLKDKLQEQKHNVRLRRPMRVTGGEQYSEKATFTTVMTNIAKVGIVIHSKGTQRDTFIQRYLIHVSDT